MKQSQFINIELNSFVGGRGLPGFHRVLSASIEKKVNNIHEPESLASVGQGE